MRTETTAREELFQYTLTARNKLLNAVNIPSDSYDETTENALISQCPRNAVVLLHELEQSWSHGEVVLRTGALDTGAVQVSQTTSLHTTTTGTTSKETE